MFLGARLSRLRFFKKFQRFKQPPSSSQKDRLSKAFSGRVRYCPKNNGLISASAPLRRG